MTEEDFDITDEILDCAKFLLSNIKPSEWAEANRMMTSDVSPIAGMLSYKNSPYTKEIVDCCAPDHPARIIAVMKGAQIGFSTTVIEAAIGWIISQNPGNILFLIGHDDLVDESIAKVDRMIDNSGIRHLIKTNTQRAKNMKTGDTNRKKEFPGGNLIGGIANHKTLRNRSVQYGFIDDFEAMKGATKEAGSTTEMIEQRFAAYRQKMKLYYISTPERKETSNIEPVYLMGDQRKYFIPCPCDGCGQFINLEWEKRDESGKIIGGIVYDLTEKGELIPGTVRYKCQICGGKFDDKNKNELLRKGEWRPTAEPSKEGYYSYHISSLYAPTYMFDWQDYVYKYLEANPIGQPVNESKMQTFKNLVLGETYEGSTTAIAANALRNNEAAYDVGMLPEKLSMKHGNGRIVLLTWAGDLGGRYIGDQIGSQYDDARLDWQLIAHTESGATYSIKHDSIGTFKNAHLDVDKETREKWSYDMSKHNSVWRVVDAILSADYKTDTGRTMKIQIAGLDTGFAEHFVWPYIDSRQNRFTIIGLKGDKENVYVPIEDNTAVFKPGQTHPNLFILKVGKLKDQLARRIGLKWDKYSQQPQPPGYMNFPRPSNGLYSYEGFYSHYESEERKLDKKGNFIWQKKTPTSQNHFFDTDVYNSACKEILMNRIFREIKADVKEYAWPDFCHLIIHGRLPQR